MDLLEGQMEWLGAATLALFIGITQLTILAALSGAPLDSRAFWLLFAPYMLYMLIWTIRFTRWAVRRPPEDATAGI